ncbi:uncharacterized protein CDAR_176091 [Caerostris darwini]|uniref:Uncharacterized protein n=1 Tax=Caerostris darwini TaxID=1538125 RepID=A0AAV4WQV0_9ARAC|nr:uncharacterized protein CDAR_176091 [Caerostris darwini]
MDIGPEFDDDYFEKPIEKRANTPSNYEAKIFRPFWFMDNNSVNADRSAEDVLVALKHRADFYYFSRNYRKAIEMYERCLKLVPSSNNTWKREFMENLAYSFLHENNAEKALEWSLKLEQSAYNLDQKIVSMNIIATACHKLGRYAAELEALHHCLETHKSWPEFWYRLGLAYAGLFEIDLPGYYTSKPSQEEETCCRFKSKLNLSKHPRSQENDSPSAELECAIQSTMPCDCGNCETHAALSLERTGKCQNCFLGTYTIASCMIKTRTMIDSGGNNHLGVERDELLKEKIDSCLKHMEIEQSFIDEASKSLGPEFMSGLKKKRAYVDDDGLTINKKSEVQE